MSETKELMSLEEMQKELAVVAKKEADAEKLSANHLSIKGKRFSLGDEKLGNELDVVVVATAYENAWYESAFNPDKISPPACFSVSETGEDMVHHTDSPNPQNSTCQGCPMNEWGSAKVGKGKACKNGRRLVLAAYGEDGLGKDLVMLRLPPTSIKNWAAYAKAVNAAVKLPTWAVVTKLTIDQDRDYPVVAMELVGPLQNAQELHAVQGRRTEAMDLSVEPYDVSGYEGSIEQPELSKSQKSKMS